MKIRLDISNHQQGEVIRSLKEGDVEFNEPADLVLSDISPDFLMGADGPALVRMPVGDIEYFESFGHEVFASFQGREYKVRYSLEKLSGDVLGREFFQIGISYIINVRKIREVSPTLSMRYKVKMFGGQVLVVSRSYSKAFKERMGF